MARAYLSSSRARKLIVEIDYVAGSAPSQSAIDHLRSVLRDVCSKPDGVEVRRDDQIPAGDGSYSFEEIGRLEARHRDVHSSGSTASMWIVYLDGSLEDEQGTLGVAFQASGAAIFPEGIDTAATAVVAAGSIERAVITHEAGHLLGLINLVEPSRYDHEDPKHPKHSKYDDSVMYWAIEDVSIAALLTGGPPATFDQYDRADLKALAAG